MFIWATMIGDGILDYPKPNSWRTQFFYEMCKQGLFVPWEGSKRTNNSLEKKEKKRKLSKDSIDKDKTFPIFSIAFTF